MASCEENRRLLKLVVDAWEYCGRVKELVAVTDGQEQMALETELKDAYWIATRLSAKQNEHVKTCLICSTPPVQ